MAKSSWTAGLCGLALLATLGCSSSDSNVSEELQLVEARAAQALQAMAFLLVELDPFAPAPIPSAGVPPDPCTDVSAGYCNLGGSVLECTTESTDIDIEFRACEGNLVGPNAGVGFSADGVLTYAVGQDVPRGTVSFSIDSEPDGEWEYEMVFNHIDQVLMTVTGVDAGTMADCVGSLSTPTVDCELIEPMM